MFLDFFRDASGNLSWGRLSSSWCVAAAIGCVISKQHDLVGTFLTAAATLYTISKAQQVGSDWLRGK